MKTLLSELLKSKKIFQWRIHYRNMYRNGLIIFLTGRDTTSRWAVKIPWKPKIVLIQGVQPRVRMSRLLQAACILQIRTFHRLQDILQTGPFINRTFYRKDIINTGHFLDRTFEKKDFSQIQGLCNLRNIVKTQQHYT